MGKDVLLKATQLSHKFEYELFSDIDLTLYQKESIAIIGVSGSGKSTLLHILSSLLKPLSGEVFYQNNSLYNLNLDDILKIRRDDFGIIFQNHYLFKGFNAKENLYMSKLLSGNDIDFQLLQRLKIKDIIGQNIGQLSGGQQQRLSIVRVLIKKPKVIFADEPTGNLDKKTANDVFDELIQYIYKENVGMITVTHNLELAKRCDRVYKLENKRLIQIK
jgi:putative ABC transport system ATP-binding protein